MKSWNIHFAPCESEGDDSNESKPGTKGVGRGAAVGIGASGGDLGAKLSQSSDMRTGELTKKTFPSYKALDTPPAPAATASHRTVAPVPALMPVSAGPSTAPPLGLSSAPGPARPTPALSSATTSIAKSSAQVVVVSSSASCHPPHGRLPGASPPKAGALNRAPFTGAGNALNQRFNSHDMSAHVRNGGVNSTYSSYADVYVNSHPPIMCPEARKDPGSGAPGPSSQEGRKGSGLSLMDHARAQATAGNGIVKTGGTADSSQLIHPLSNGTRNASSNGAPNAQTNTRPQVAKPQSMWDKLKQESLTGSSQPQSSLMGNRSSDPIPRQPSPFGINHAANSGAANGSNAANGINGSHGGPGVPRLTDFSGNKKSDGPNVPRLTDFSGNKKSSGGAFQGEKSNFADIAPRKSGGGGSSRGGVAAKPAHSNSSGFQYHVPKFAADVVVNSAAKKRADTPTNGDATAQENEAKPVDAWAKLKMEASGQAVPERPNYNPKRPPLQQNFFERENDAEKRDKLMEQTKTLVRSQLISAGKQGRS